MANLPYAALLAKQDPLMVLEETPRRLNSIAELLGATGLDKAWAPGKWTGSEILCHLADCEIAFGFRYRQALSEPHHVVQTFDQDGWAKLYPLSAADALQAFTGLRKWNLDLLKKAGQDIFEKPVSHPERGEMTFRDLIQITAGHDLNHLEQLQKLASDRPLA